MRKSVSISTAVIRAIHRIVFEDAMPTRVMLQNPVEAHPPKPGDMEAISEIYIRDDGWSLGANHRYARDAWRIWMGSWVAHLRRQTWGWQVNAFNLGGNDDNQSQE